MTNRIKNKKFLAKLTSAEQAATFIKNGDNVAVSGFTGSGYPKALPTAIADVANKEHAQGREYKISLFTGASTSTELDGVLAQANAINLRMPYQSDPQVRNSINNDNINYVDVHLGQVAQRVERGHFGKINVAVIEVTGINKDGSLIPATSVGNNQTYLDNADKIILEVNSWMPQQLEGMHDIYIENLTPPNRQPIPLTQSFQRIGSKYLRCDYAKVVAVVETNAQDRNSPFSPIDDTSIKIAKNLVDFLKSEVSNGRLPANLLPLQSGVGNIANAVLVGLADAGFTDLEAYTEVVQDGMLNLLTEGVLKSASTTAFSLSEEGMQDFVKNIDFYKKRLIFRPQNISNHSEIINRLGCIAMNGIIEADIYGNINSTNVMGSKIQNGIGGSNDFARNSYLSVFLTPSIAKNGQISCIVPMVSHHDHTEHDVSIIVTEQGLADLRGLSPKQRAEKIIDNCAHPSYRKQLRSYFTRACKKSFGKHTPHILNEALSWHQRFIKTGNMLKK